MRRTAIAAALTLAVSSGITAVVPHPECRTYDGPTIVRVCAPSESPDGYPITRLWEDGSAHYGESLWVYLSNIQDFELAI